MYNMFLPFSTPAHGRGWSAKIDAFYIPERCLHMSTGGYCPESGYTFAGTRCAHLACPWKGSTSEPIQSVHLCLRQGDERSSGLCHRTLDGRVTHLYGQARALATHVWKYRTPIYNGCFVCVWLSLGLCYFKHNWFYISPGISRGQMRIICDEII